MCKIGVRRIERKFTAKSIITLLATGLTLVPSTVLPQSFYSGNDLHDLCTNANSRARAYIAGASDAASTFYNSVSIPTMPKNCTAEGVTLRTRATITESDRLAIDTTTPAGRLVFHVFASIAQFERERISERTKEGLTAARKRGRIGGRPTALSSERRAEVVRMRDQEGRGIAELARLFEVSPNTIRRA